MRQIAETTSTINTKKVEVNSSIYDKKKMKSPIIVIIIIICIILISIGIIIRFNLGNLTEKYLRHSLQDVPILNNILPIIDENIDKYENLSKEELLKEISSLENQLEEKENNNSSYQNTVKRLNTEIKRLKEIEEQQLQFKAEKEEFNRRIATENSESFVDFFESIYPEIAAEIYKELLGEELEIQEIKQYAEPFQTMDPSSAASVIEEMIITDMDLVVLIFNNIDSEQQAAIIEEMHPEEAARLLKSLAP